MKKRQGGQFMARHLLYILGSLGAVSTGVNLHYQIVSGGAISIGISVLACIFISLGLYYTCKLWYAQGSIDALQEMQRRLEDRR